jgi:hypothetical protein
MATTDELISKTSQLLEEMAADKKKAKDKEAAEAWTKTAAISIVVIAVLGAVAAQRSGSLSTRSLKHLNTAIYHQVEASDEWSYFQAKSTKANIYELGIEQLKVAAPGPDQARVLADLEKKVARYRKEQDEAMTKAKGIEAARDQENLAADANGAAGAKVGLALLMFQAAVALASICLVTKRKMLWYAALAVAALATVEMVRTLVFLAPPT